MFKYTTYEPEYMFVYKLDLKDSENITAEIFNG